MPDREWLRGTDADVTAELQRVLVRIERGRPHAVLGLPAHPPPDAVRAAFLEATKSYHPARFARRPAAIQRLANEVFLAIKVAYEDLSASAVTSTGSTPHRGDTTSSISGSAPPRKEGAAPKSPPSTPPSYRDDPRFVEASLLCDRGEYAAAKERFGELSREQPRERALRAHYHYASSGVLLAQGRASQATTELKRALAADSSFAPAKRALARIVSGELRAKAGKS